MTEAEKYISLIKTLKSNGFTYFDSGVDRIFSIGLNPCNVFTFTYRDKPNSNANDIVHLMVKCDGESLKFIK